MSATTTFTTMVRCKPDALNREVVAAHRDAADQFAAHHEVSISGDPQVTGSLAEDGLAVSVWTWPCWKRDDDGL